MMLLCLLTVLFVNSQLVKTKPKCLFGGIKGTPGIEDRVIVLSQCYGLLSLNRDNCLNKRLYKIFYNMNGEHTAQILFSKSLCHISRIRRVFPENCDDSFYLLDPIMVVATSAFWLPIPELVTGIQRKVSKMVCMISKTVNTVSKILGDISQEMGELRNCY